MGAIKLARVLDHKGFKTVNSMDCVRVKGIVTAMHYIAKKNPKKFRVIDNAFLSSVTLEKFTQLFDDVPPNKWFSCVFIDTDTGRYHTYREL